VTIVTLGSASCRSRILRGFPIGSERGSNYPNESRSAPYAMLHPGPSSSMLIILNSASASGTRLAENE